MLRKVCYESWEDVESLQPQPPHPVGLVDACCLCWLLPIVLQALLFTIASTRLSFGTPMKRSDPEKQTLKSLPEGAFHTCIPPKFSACESVG